MPTFDMPKTYDPSASERRIYEWWESIRLLQAGDRPARRRAVRDQHPAAQHHRRAAPGPRHVRLAGRPDDPLQAHARLRGAVGARATTTPASPRSSRWRRCWRREGIRRQDIGREEFLRRTWAWKEKYGDHIVRQLRRLGASCDWDRMRFTLDEGLSRAVREAFVRLYRMGLIYRGEYLINWSPGLQTAVSDLEVEYSEEDATLYYFKYPIAGADLDDGPGQGLHPGGDHAARDDPGRHRRGGASRRRALSPPDRRDLPGADPQAARSR